MNIKQSFLLALKNMKNSKLRSFLTMLGIIVGVASVITMTGIMGSFKNYLYKALDSIGSNDINVTIYSPSYSNNKKIQQIVDNNPDYFEDFFIAKSALTKLKTDTKNYSVTILGTSSKFIDHFYKIESGRNFNYVDETNGTRNCIIGSYLALKVFGESSPIGKTISVANTKFKVIGVLEKYQSDLVVEDTYVEVDSFVIIPEETIGTLNALSSSYPMYTLVKNSNVSVEEATNLFNNELKNNKIDGEAYSMSEFMDELTQEFNIIEYVLVAIAALSLFVGGIGIMNIMLVTVTERIKEIGIRKSLGAHPREILTQFLIEAASISLVGGGIGLGFAIFNVTVFCKVVNKYMEANMSPYISISSVLLAITISIGIGIIFGYFPARKASKLDPIDALRYE